MLSNAYFVAKFRFDTAENEPAKNLQNFREMHFSKMIPQVTPDEEAYGYRRTNSDNSESGYRRRYDYPGGGTMDYEDSIRRLMNK